MFVPLMFVYNIDLLYDLNMQLLFGLYTGVLHFMIWVNGL